MVEMCIEFREGMTMNEVYGPAMEIAEITKKNLGYFAGYYNHETRARVERLFACEHPVFGKISVQGPPSAEEAFRKGLEFGRKVGER